MSQYFYNKFKINIKPSYNVGYILFITSNEARQAAKFADQARSTQQRCHTPTPPHQVEEGQQII